MVFWWVSFRVAEHKDEQTKARPDCPADHPWGFVVEMLEPRQQKHRCTALRLASE